MHEQLGEEQSLFLFWRINMLFIAEFNVVSWKQMEKGIKSI